MKLRDHQHLFPIINAMVEEACRDAADDDEPISCHEGCDHCCHLFIEVSWEEAVELALWVDGLLPDRRTYFIEKVQESAREARSVLRRAEGGEKYLKPTIIEDDIPEDAFDIFFYEKKRPCPFLVESRCSSYESRPTACRLHLVSSDPRFCANDVPDECEDYEIPEAIEELKEEATPAIHAVERDGRWGQMSVVVEAVMVEMGMCKAPDLVAEAAEQSAEAPAKEQPSALRVVSSS